MSDTLVPAEIKSLTLQSDEVLLVRFGQGAVNLAQMQSFQKKLCSLLQSQNILVYCVDNVEFLKVKLEEKLIDQLIDDEIQK